ncbi:Retrovirus-related Pol polyprotein from transposon TNT 1-94 [Sesamum angolense]|uniref:Retrovirus-related Pol polyprotein from transposon TNT 1-94 n=1 Tax=Sesamum angolense TaxID=2727404 RepID=A0AAE2BTX4_9LAMI|nr:Retrovirus-related Pol polyprotein from transposon TNT 1-94 [Sesamum angolense]
MTKKHFVGQSMLASNLLDLIHSDVCGPLNTQARGEFSYLITFTDNHSWYGYVYLMRYKSEAFGRFKEFNLKVEKQTGRKIEALRSDRGVRSMMSFTKLSFSFWGYALDMETKWLNMAPSKTVAQTPYQIWHGKPVSYKYVRVWGSPTYVKRLAGDKLDSRSSLCRFVGNPKETMGYYFYDASEQKVFISQNTVLLEKGFQADTRREELLLEESSEATPQTDAVTSFAPIVPTNDIHILRRSTRVSQQPERYGFLGLTSQLDNDPKTYGEAMSNIDPGKWIEAKIRDGLHEFKQDGYENGYLNGFVQEEIYMDQPEGFTSVGEEQENDLDPCIYKKVSRSLVAFLVLYVDDILHIGNDVKMLCNTKAWLST